MTKRSKFKHSPVWAISMMMSTLLMLDTFFSVAANAQTPVLQPSQLKPSIHLLIPNDDLAHHFSEDKLSFFPLLINDKKIDVPYIKYSAHQPIVKGLAIVIGDIQTQGQLDPRLHAVALQLPQWGWHTLMITPQLAHIIMTRKENAVDVSLDEDKNSISGDSQPFNPAVDRDKARDFDGNNQQTTENESEQNQVNKGNLLPNKSPQLDIKPSDMQAANLPYTRNDFLLYLSALNNALQSKFAQQPGYKLIYAQGKSASGLISLLNQETRVQVDALVINNPYWPESMQNKMLPEQIASLSVPVLDFTSVSNNNWAKQTSVDRAMASKVNLKSLYRQREITADEVGPYHQDDVAKELISWTYFLGW